MPKDQSDWEREDDQNDMDTSVYGPVFRKEFFREAFRLQDKIVELNTSSGISLSDICFKPLEPDNDNCLIMSPFNYFQVSPMMFPTSVQNKIENLDLERADEMNDYNYFHHLMQCMRSPFTMSTNLKLSCFGSFGGPIQPYIALGNFNEEAGYGSAKGLLITILLNNYDDAASNEPAMEWELAFVKFLRSVQSDLFSISFMAQRSIQVSRRFVFPTFLIGRDPARVQLRHVHGHAQLYVHVSLRVLFVGPVPGHVKQPLVAVHQFQVPARGRGYLLRGPQRDQLHRPVRLRQHGGDADNFRGVALPRARRGGGQRVPVRPGLPAHREDERRALGGAHFPDLRRSHSVDDPDQRFRSHLLLFG